MATRLGAGPKVGIGMFLFNEEKHLEEAISSLLAQEYTNFQLVVLDDCSTDRTLDIVQEFGRRDARVKFMKNERRQGYIANYLITFANADSDVKYFAWVAGHDRHHPKWLSRLVAELEGNDEIIMAYPLTQRIGENGDDLHVPSPEFETVGLPLRERTEIVCKKGIGFGNMIYGLFRASALRRAGVFRKVLLPDTLLITELSLFGTVKQVKEVL